MVVPPGSGVVPGTELDLPADLYATWGDVLGIAAKVRFTELRVKIRLHLTWTLGRDPEP